MNTSGPTGTPEVGPGVILPTTANTERYAATPLHLSLTTMPGWSASSKTVGGWNPAEDQIGPGRPFITASLNAYQPTWQSPPDIFGYFCDGGLYCEATSAIPTHHGARIVVNYIDRLSFSPAYSDPVTTLQHYWTCAHGTEKSSSRTSTRGVNSPVGHPAALVENRLPPMSFRQSVLIPSVVRQSARCLQRTGI